MLVHLSSVCRDTIRLPWQRAKIDREATWLLGCHSNQGLLSWRSHSDPWIRPTQEVIYAAVVSLDFGTLINTHTHTHGQRRAHTDKNHRTKHANKHTQTISLLFLSECLLPVLILYTCVLTINTEQVPTRPLLHCRHCKPDPADLLKIHFHSCTPTLNDTNMRPV